MGQSRPKSAKMCELVQQVDVYGFVWLKLRFSVIRLLNLQIPCSSDLISGIALHWLKQTTIRVEAAAGQCFSSNRGWLWLALAPG